MNVIVESGVTGRIIATHREPFGSAAHAHVWDVEVYFETRASLPPVDARTRIESLDRATAELGFDLAESLGERATNEGIGTWLLSRLHIDGAFKVGVKRALERSFAYVSIDPAAALERAAEHESARFAA